ncbi:hypothetical protein HK097_004495 [Rhizophlyctis rosea]|uniref:N-acetyltransferase domain-containing protein n=1 Tax=Rhizophlyctis rosea TaxID=64517 RepID=A0AAD5S1I3_9FUNG|nr:hypothetical protein HK097_004495 [Rhizophlyctis rosea]
MSYRVKNPFAALTQKRKEAQKKAQYPESDSDVPNEDDCMEAQCRRRSMELKTKQDLIDQVKNDEDRKAFRCSSAYRRVKAEAERKWRRAMDWQTNRKLTPSKEQPTPPSIKFTDIYKTPHRYKMFNPGQLVPTRSKSNLAPSPSGSSTSVQPVSGPPPYTPEGSDDMEGVQYPNQLPPYTPSEGDSQSAGPSTPLARRTSMHSMNSIASMASNLSLSAASRRSEDEPKRTKEDRAKDRHQQAKEMFNITSSRTAEDRALERRTEGLEASRIERTARFWENRGLSTAPVRNEWQCNFGNELRITDAYNRDLDRDWTQTFPKHKQTMLQLSNGKNVRWITIEGVPPKFKSTQFAVWNQASAMVQAAFEEKGVQLNLRWHSEEYYVSEILVDMDTDLPIAAIQYAFMTKFVWLDTLTVDKGARGLGIARVLLQRCIEVAQDRGKDLLLLAIPDVVEMYKKFGFVIETRYPRKEAPDHPLMTLHLKKD